jgi:tRNA (guanine37-N1)-methyltransferase
MVIRTGMEQWSVRVQRENGESTRLFLLRRGLLDPRLKIRAEGDELVFPVLAPQDEKTRDCFEPLEPPVSLPRHELIGGIALIQDRDPEGAERLLRSRPSLHTVLHPLTAVEGKYRTRRFEVLAGVPTTRTEYVEYGHRFIIDLGIAYFSPRLSEERQRILRRMGKSERVLDMFAGVGPFAISIAPKAALVIAWDINPAAVSLMLENCLVNRTQNVLPVLGDASVLCRIFPREFSRIIMNLPLGGKEFLDGAFSLCRSGGFIHFYTLQSEEGAYTPILEKYPVASVNERRVRSYSPGTWHAVYDIQVE